MNKWDKRFVEQAEFVKGWSKDRRTKVGAVIANDENTELVMGYNGFPRSANDDVDERHEHPLKLMWTEHAERNAIFKAAREGIQLNGGKIYCTYFPCCDCARAIVQVGLKKVFAPEPDFSDKRWGKSFQISYEMLKECGVSVVFTDKI